MTQQRANVTPCSMQNRRTRTARYGPWLVGLGAALWGTESAWRIPLNELFDAKVIVFWEHVFILIMFLPILIPRLREIPKVHPRTWGFLIFSGFAGSAVGTIFFTLALKHGNPTVVNVILNIQPVISTIGAFLLFGDRLARRFFSVRRNRNRCGHLCLCCVSDSDRNFFRARGLKPGHWLRADLCARSGDFQLLPGAASWLACRCDSLPACASSSGSRA